MHRLLFASKLMKIKIINRGKIKSFHILSRLAMNIVCCKDKEIHIKLRLTD